MPTLVLTKDDLAGAGILNSIQIPSSGGDIIVDEMGDLLIKTGQTTSYRTGDDGDLEAGREVDFFTLGENNPFGNTNRFTDELGGSTYTNNIVIDWSTYDNSEVLGYYIGDKTTNRLWDDAIDWGVALSVGTFTTGWRLWNIRELFNIANYGDTYPLNYAPFNVNFNMWTSTTFIGQTDRAFRIFAYGLSVGYAAKTTTYATVATRDFTVTGTTLT
jgi:hypothetical protein